MYRCERSAIVSVSVLYTSSSMIAHPILLMQLLEVGDVDAEVLLAREQDVRHAELAQLVQEQARVLREPEA